jgi:hypothetical protein
LIFATGDTHGTNSIHKLSSQGWRPLIETSTDLGITKKDYLAILGDFGLLWAPTPTREELFWLEWLQEKPWTTLVVDGNHENHERFAALPQTEMFGGTVGVIMEGIYHLKRGEIYTIDGYTFFVMGGGLSIDQQYRVMGLSWWPQEIPTKEEFDYGLDNLEKVGWEVDYILTHVPPKKVIRMLEEYLSVGDKVPLSEKLHDIVALYLNEIYDRTKRKGWYCGHMHVDKTFGDVHILYDTIERIV